MKRHELVWSLGLCLAVLATNRYEALPAAGEVPGDVYAYAALADAAPGLPDEPLQFHHAQRIAVPFLVGLLHDATGFPLHRLFLGATVLLTLVILIAVATALRGLDVGRRHSSVVLAVLALNPWVFRMCITFPEMLNDLVFVLGFAVMLQGLLAGRMLPVLVGQVVASAGRQTGLLLVPVVLVWMWQSRTWEGVTALRRAAIVVSTGTLAVGIYLATGYVAARVSLESTNLDHLTGLLTTRTDPWTMAAFLTRMAIAPAIPLLLLFVLRHRPREEERGPDPHAIPLLLAASACVWTQPLLAGPGVTGGNGPRLVAMGLVPLCLALALRLRATAAFTGQGGLRRLFMLGGLLALGSLHHWYVLAAVPTPADKIFFAAAYAIACAGCVMVTASDARTAGRPVID